MTRPDRPRRTRPGLFLEIRIAPGFMIASLLAASLAVGCGQDRDAPDDSAPKEDPPQGEAPPMDGLAAEIELGPPHLLAFACGAGAHYLAVLGPGGDTVELHAPDGVHTLAQRASASGAKYADRHFTLWTKGQEEILLEIDGERGDDCRPTGRQRLLTAAYQAGYDLRAGGNEPGWTLLAGPQSIRLDLQDRPGAIFPGLEPGELTGAGVIARESGPHTLRVSIEQVPCRDTMSGEPSPLAVTVELDGGILRGCGVLLQRGGGAR